MWPELLKGRIDGLHKTRVASRRIREALPIVAASAPPAKVKKLARKMRTLGKTIGPIRELDVELSLLEEEARHAGLSSAAVASIRRSIAARRLELSRRLQDEPPVKDLKKLIKRLNRVGKREEGRGRKAARKGEEAWRSVLGARLLRRARRLGDAVEQAGPLYAPERLHDVRILTKKLRYALEIADDFGVEGTKPLVKALKKQQDQLGHLHDLEMLLTRVREAEASPVAGAHLDDLAIYADSLERECRRLHATYVERRRALIDCVNEVRLVVVPSLATEARRQARILPMPDHEERRSRIRSNNVDAPAREK